LFFAVALLGSAALAYNPPIDTAGPLTVRIHTQGLCAEEEDGPCKVDTSMKVRLPVSVILENRAATAIEGQVHLEVIDRWRPEPASPVRFTATALGTVRLSFAVIPGAGTYSAAHYPIHAFAEFEYEGKRLTAHPILVVETKFSNTPRVPPSVEWKPVQVPGNGALGLWRLPVRRLKALVVQQEPIRGPLSDATGPTTTGLANALEFGGPDPSGAPIRFPLQVERGQTHDALSMQLGPRTRYIGGVGQSMAASPLPDLGERPLGMIWGNYTQAPLPSLSEEHVTELRVEYPLALPRAAPIHLRFGAAVGGPGAERGVTFRVRVSGFAAPGAVSTVFERVINTETWQDEDVDLGSFAGRSVCLNLEVSANSSDASLAYWGEPVIVAGEPVQVAPFPTADGASRLLGSIERAGARYEVRLWPGQRGLLDATIGFLSGGVNPLYVHGFQVRVLGDVLGDSRSACRFLEVREEPAGERYRLRHRFDSWEGSFDILAEIWIEHGTLRTRIWIENAPRPRHWRTVHLEEVSTGPWSERASRVYAGDGNVIQDPQAFQMPFDGHLMSTSFFGLDFPGGISIVEGVDSPPETFRVDPREHLYDLLTPEQQTLTLIPSPNVWEGSKAWHDVNGLHAAGGVFKLAGRFVFDLWGGFGDERSRGYREGSQDLTRAFRYGLTDSIVIWHNWQRWGYDYRLPDIYPPDPKLGTLAEFAELVQNCTRHGVLFAPHDNYVDIYPDAEGFSYRDITFNPLGQPVRAYGHNVGGSEAQSYRLRADRAHPFVERNLKLIREGFAPTSYFLDVWSAHAPIDFFSSEGDYFDRIYARDAQRKEFAFIRDYLGNAPTISECGHDQLIGWLDGAQVQHLRVDDLPSMVWRIKCAASERIPWFDSAHHDRFVLHGAGYPGRYAAGLDLQLHGNYSDDYISTEVLDGHPAMVSDAFSRDVVRAYWLLHDLGRALALRRMDGVRFAGGNLHCQEVRWDNGGEVWVNRSADNWTVAGHTLPQYGFYARIPTSDGLVEAAIELRDGATVEWSRSPSMTYENGRSATAGAFRLTREGEALILTPLPESARFTARFRWNSLPWKLREPREAEVIDEAGKVLRRVPVHGEKGTVTLDCDPLVSAYRLR
jgi:hypothetical protein